MGGNRANHIAVGLRALILGLFAAFGIMVIGATSANANDGDLLGSLTEQVTEPLAKQAAAPVIEESSTAIIEPVVEKAAAPVIEPVVSHVAEPVVQQVAEPVIQQVANPIVNQVAVPVVEPVVETVAAPIVNQVVKPIAEPVVEPVAKPVVEKVLSPVVSPAVAPVESTLQPVTDSVRSTLDPVTKTVGHTLDPVTEPAIEHVVEPVADLDEQVNKSIGEPAVAPHASSTAGPADHVVEHVAEADSASTINPAPVVSGSEPEVLTTSSQAASGAIDRTHPSGGLNVVGPVQLTSMNIEPSPTHASIFDSTAHRAALVLASASMSNSDDVDAKSTGGNFDVAAPGVPAPAGSSTSSAGNTSATAYLTDNYLLPHQRVGGQQHHGSWALPSSTFSHPGFSPD